MQREVIKGSKSSMEVMCCAQDYTDHLSFFTSIFTPYLTSSFTSIITPTFTSLYYTFSKRKNPDILQCRGSISYLQIHDF